MTEPTTPETVEAVARALLGVEDSWNDHEWEQLPEGVQALFRKQARAAITAIPTQPGEVVQADKELIEALRLHAFDDSGEQDLPTHLCNIAATRLAALSQPVTVASPVNAPVADESHDYPKWVWYTPSDNSSRKYVREDLASPGYEAGLAEGRREVERLSEAEAKWQASQPVCTCGVSKGLCPLHEPTTEGEDGNV